MANANLFEDKVIFIYHSLRMRIRLTLHFQLQLEQVGDGKVKYTNVI